jgi:DNA-binding MarR family transcriptional regulator
MAAPPSSARRAPRRRGDGLVTAIRAAADRLRRCVAPLLAPYDLTLQQYNVLRILRAAGGDGLPTLAVGERMTERAPGVTRLLDRLERKGFVARVRGADRRQVRCRLTRRGRAVLRALDAPVARVDGAAVAALSVAAQRRLERLLARLAPPSVHDRSADRAPG